MDRYIGLDVHATSCTMAVVGPAGRKLTSEVIETNGRSLVEAIRRIPRPRHLCFEEGTQSAWLYELLSPHVDELIVAGITQSQGPKSDARDALGLAQSLRLGGIDMPVFKAPRRFALLRSLARSYDQLSRDVIRTQCRIKVLFRERGISSSGKSVYNPADRDEWMQKLPPHSQPAALILWQQLEVQRQLKAAAHKQLIAESHRHPISRVLETCPGFGPIRVALAVPVIVVPHRFRTRQQLWSYCGLGIIMRSSSDWVRRGDQWARVEVAKTRGLNSCFNRTLKWVFKGAATTIITRHPGTPLHDHYKRLLTNGTKPNLAKLTLARKIAAIFLSMWKMEAPYDTARHQST